MIGWLIRRLVAAWLFVAVIRQDYDAAVFGIAWAVGVLLLADRPRVLRLRRGGIAYRVGVDR